MTTRRYLKFFGKSSDTKKPVTTETPQNKENDEFGEFSGTNTNKLHRSRSGRLKESSRVRLAIARDTYVPPENMAQSAPVMSSTRSGMGLASRELSMHESMRVSQSLQSYINLASTKESPTSDTKSSEADNEFDLLDHNEIF